MNRRLKFNVTLKRKFNSLPRECRVATTYPLPTYPLLITVTSRSGVYLDLGCFTLYFTLPFHLTRCLRTLPQANKDGSYSTADFKL